MQAPRLEAVHPVLMSAHVTRSIRFYQLLGFVLVGQDVENAPRYAWLQRDGVELHFQWHDAREWEFPNDRPTYRFLVEDVDGLYREFRAQAAVTDIEAPSDTPWGTREFHLRDPDRNGLQFYRVL
jgi:catechol 2,3-dioxygenase-like lactoylglutathione lyase family enzyme